MAVWQRTFGKASGAYLKAGANELYVRQDLLKNAAKGGWLWYVDGILMGAESGEAVAQAASEAAVRAMSRTHTGAMATAAGKPNRAA